MTCYHPLKGWRAKRTNPSTGRRPVVFSRDEAFVDMPVEVPCGQCIGCRLDRSRAWAIRCIHEAQLHEDNSFITLTYDEEHLPTDGSLHIEHWQDFMKRLRRRRDFRGLGPVRFFHCGEYGDRLGRPHYHALLFGHGWPDKTLWQKTGSGSRIYRSDSLESLWPFGFSSVGDLTFESAAYVARYVMKKVTGPAAELRDPETGLSHYETIDFATGEIKEKRPEYVTMSRRPGLAHEWYQKYKTDVYPNDEVVYKGQKLRPPRYYDKQLELTDPTLLQYLKAGRAAKAKKLTPERLRVKEYVAQSRAKRLKRGLSR